MKIKALRYKDTKEFVEIVTMGQMHMIFTSGLPRVMTSDANIDLLEKYYNKPDFNEIDFSNFELIEYEFIEFGEVGADIRNKLSPPKNLIALLEVYFDKKTDYEQMMGLKKIIEKEMEQTKESIKYISEIL